MNSTHFDGWLRIALSLILAFLFAIFAYLAFTGPSTAIRDDLTEHSDGDLQPTLLDYTGEYTVHLPIVLDICGHESTREFLRGTASFVGEAEILTPRNCTTGLWAETPYIAIGVQVQ